MSLAIEREFPFEEIDGIAELESYRKEINRPLYHIHKWWAKRLGSVFRSVVSGALSEGAWPSFYSFQDFEGKVVLDPFMGSGTTLGEAIKLGAKVIGSDVNPVSTFMVRQGLTQVNMNALGLAFWELENAVKQTILSYYQTVLPGSKQLVPALYYFWVKVVTTPGGEEIPLFSNYVFSKNAYPKKKPKSQVLCPCCWGVFEAHYKSEWEVCGICHAAFNPQRGPVDGGKVVGRSGESFKIKHLISLRTTPPVHKLYAIMALDTDGNKIYIKPSDYDFDLLRQATLDLSRMEGELPIPNMLVRSGVNTDQARGYNYKAWRDFFSDRQLLCLGILLREILKIKEPAIREHFVCLFSGVLEFNNMFCSFKGEGTGAVRHMFSNHVLKPERTPLENNVWGVHGKSSGSFSTLFRSRLMKAKQYLDNPFEICLKKNGAKCSSEKLVFSKPISVRVVEEWDGFLEDPNAALVLNRDSSDLPIPASSVDAVVTDPPYFDFVNYSELSDFFYAWISLALAEDYAYLSRLDSSHVNEVQDKDCRRFVEKISGVFCECFRVLKPSGVLCFSYHHSTVDGWLAIYEAILNSGFYICAAHPVKAEMAVAAPKSSSRNPINIDSILVCKKSSSMRVDTDCRRELELRFKEYVLRFLKIGRKLSLGDRLVIACSQALVIGSCVGMSLDEVSALIEWAHQYCVRDSECDSDYVVKVG